jgi:hypothetical protein
MKRKFPAWKRDKGVDFHKLLKLRLNRRFPRDDKMLLHIGRLLCDNGRLIG